MSNVESPVMQPKNSTNFMRIEESYSSAFEPRYHRLSDVMDLDDCDPALSFKHNFANADYCEMFNSENRNDSTIRLSSPPFDPREFKLASPSIDLSISPTLS